MTRLELTVNFKGLIPPELEQLLISQRDICGDVFLVGGAIRNTYFGKKVDDLDFVTIRNSIKIAKKLADHFKGDFYVLDEKRETARALILVGSMQYKVDIARIAGESLKLDLRLRDFTMNAMAMQLPLSDEIIDPMGGVSDISKGQLKPCSPSSFEMDPVRVLRAVRFMNEYHLLFNPDYIQDVRRVSRNLHQISGERKRDELVNILEKTDTQRSLNILMEFGILENLFPETALLEKMDLDNPHVPNVWAHTCTVAAYCQQFIGIFRDTGDPTATHPRIRTAFDKLKKYSNNIIDILETSITPGRTKNNLLLLSAIFHDVGKGVIQPILKEGKKCYPGHAKEGSKIMVDKAREMGFSNLEIDFLKKIVRYHMYISKTPFTEKGSKDVQIYKFFKKTGEAGILIGFLYLADVLATVGESITDKRWNQVVDSVCSIFEAYFLRFKKVVNPPKLIGGHELIHEFNLTPGKNFAKILNQVVEEQIKGEITSKPEAMDFVRNYLTEQK
jgi:poly(A) polymerase